MHTYQPISLFRTRIVSIFSLRAPALFDRAYLFLVNIYIAPSQRRDASGTDGELTAAMGSVLDMVPGEPLERTCRDPMGGVHTCKVRVGTGLIAGIGVGDDWRRSALHVMAGCVGGNGGQG